MSQGRLSVIVITGKADGEGTPLPPPHPPTFAITFLGLWRICAFPFWWLESCFSGQWRPFHFYAVSICEDISSYDFAIYLNTDVVNEHFDKASDKQKEFMSAIFPQFGATEESATRVTGKFEGIAPDPEE